MNRITTPLILCLFAFSQANLRAQTSIQIQNLSAYDSLNNFCQTPSNAYIWFYGFATGYSVGDSVTLDFSFGDGTDTTFKQPIPQTFYGSLNHTYITAGNYTAQLIATGPDGKADTALLMLIISDTCGTISGHVFNDLNGNCSQDAGEDDLGGIPVHLIFSGSVMASHSTDSSGNYYFSAGLSNSYDIEIADLSAYGYVVLCPSGGSYTNVTPPSSGNDFALQCLNSYDLAGSFWAWRFRPGFDAYGSICVWNAYCQPTSGTVSVVTHNPNVSFVSANPAPDNISGDTLSWDFTNLTNTGYWYNYNGFCAYITFHTSTNAQIGDTVCFDWWITPTAGDSNVANNSGTFCTTVRNSWDPNAKAVTPLGSGNNGGVLANTPMQYVVMFQNTGNDVAYNVHIVDTIDSDLDISTLQIVESSHPMDVVVTGDVVRFNFNNIMLPDSNSDEPSSHGYVVYNISQKVDLSLGTEIENTARIYFDFNPAIVTNTTLNTIVAPSGIEQPTAGFAAVYPNPASEFLVIALNRAADVAVIDMAGRIVTAGMMEPGKNHLDVRGLSAGIYTIRLSSEDRVMTVKVVKM